VKKTGKKKGVKENKNGATEEIFVSTICAVFSLEINP